MALSDLEPGLLEGSTPILRADGHGAGADVVLEQVEVLLPAAGHDARRGDAAILLDGLEHGRAQGPAARAAAVVVVVVGDRLREALLRLDQCGLRILKLADFRAELV